MDQYMMTIKENKEIAHRIYQLVVETKAIQSFSNQKLEEKPFLPYPGQFVHIRVNDSTDPLLRRPISIEDFDASTNQTTLIYRAEGEGTRRLSKKQIGEEIDVLGPLGNGFKYKQIDINAHILLIGGGIGIPPLYYLAKELMKLGNPITTFLGFQSREDSFLIEEFSSLGEVRVSSIDGSIGTKGTVLDLITEEDKWESFYTVGPTGMMRAIQQKWKDSTMEGYISLEERMGCGVGACYACVVKVDPSVDPKGFKKVCADGPVFSFKEVLL